MIREVARGQNKEQREERQQELQRLPRQDGGGGGKAGSGKARWQKEKIATEVD